MKSEVQLYNSLFFILQRYASSFRYTSPSSRERLTDVVTGHLSTEAITSGNISQPWIEQVEHSGIVNNKTIVLSLPQLLIPYLIDFQTEDEKLIIADQLRALFYYQINEKDITGVFYQALINVLRDLEFDVLFYNPVSEIIEVAHPAHPLIASSLSLLDVEYQPQPKDVLQKIAYQDCKLEAEKIFIFTPEIIGNLFAQLFKFVLDNPIVKTYPHYAIRLLQEDLIDFYYLNPTCETDRRFEISFVGHPHNNEITDSTGDILISPVGTGARGKQLVFLESDALVEEETFFMALHADVESLVFIAAPFRQNTFKLAWLNEIFARCPNLVSLQVVNNFDSNECADVRLPDSLLYLSIKNTGPAGGLGQTYPLLSLQNTAFLQSFNLFYMQLAANAQDTNPFNGLFQLSITSNVLQDSPIRTFFPQTQQLQTLDILALSQCSEGSVFGNDSFTTLKSLNFMYQPNASLAEHDSWIAQEDFPSLRSLTSNDVSLFKCFMNGHLDRVNIKINRYTLLQQDPSLFDEVISSSSIKQMQLNYFPQYVIDFFLQSCPHLESLEMMHDSQSYKSTKVDLTYLPRRVNYLGLYGLHSLNAETFPKLNQLTGLTMRNMGVLDEDGFIELFQDAAYISHYQEPDVPISAEFVMQVFNQFKRLVSPCLDGTITLTCRIELLDYYAHQFTVLAEKYALFKPIFDLMKSNLIALPNNSNRNVQAYLNPVSSAEIEYVVSTTFVSLDPALETPLESSYRQQIYQGIDYSGEDIVLKAYPPEELAASMVTINPTWKNWSYADVVPNAYGGKKRLWLSENDWTPLDSLFFGEKLASVFSEDVAEESLQVAYNLLTGLYYVRALGLSKVKDCKISYVVIEPPAVAMETLVPILDYKYGQLMERFRHYSTDKPYDLPEQANAYDKIQAILLQERGVCAQRSIGFVYIWLNQWQGLVKQVESAKQYLLSLNPLVDLNALLMVNPNQFNSSFFASWFCQNLPPELQQQFERFITEFYCNSLLIQRMRIQLITNQLHSYVEVVDNYLGVAMKIDLGGGEKETITRANREQILEHREKAVSGSESEASDDESMSQDVVVAEEAHSIYDEKDQQQCPRVDVEQFSYLSLSDVRSRQLLLETNSDEQSDLVIDKLGMLANQQGYRVLLCNESSQISAIHTQLTEHGQLIRGQGGEFYSFATSGQPGVLLFNLDGFTANELAKINAVFESERTVDGLAIPRELIIIAVQNSDKLSAYRGKDFLSRFLNARYKAEPLKPEPVLASEDQRPCFSSPALPQQQANTVIELYQALDWPSKLLGYCLLSNRRFSRHLNPLLQDTSEEKNVLLRHAPWHLASFRRFYYATRWGQSLFVGDNWHDVSHLHFIFDRDETIAFETQVAPHSWYQVQSLTAWNKQVNFVIDRNNIKQYCAGLLFRNQEISESQGLLQHVAHQRIGIYIRDNLTAMQWMELLNNINAQGIVAEFYLSAQVVLPKEFASHTALEILSDAVLGEAPKPSNTMALQLILTNNPSQLAQQFNNQAIIMTVDEQFKPGELLYVSEIGFDEDSALSIQLDLSGLAWRLIHEEITLVIKGSPSAALINYFSTLLLDPPFLFIQGEKCLPRGRIIIVTDKPDAVKGLPYEESLVMEQVEVARHVIQEPAIEHDGEVELTVERYNAFQQQRLSLLKDTLPDSKVVVLEGETGVGKSTLVKRLALDTDHYRVYSGKQAIISWLTESVAPGVRKILFLDEANTLHESLDFLIDLVEGRSSLFSKSTLFENLDVDMMHVICASNPGSYGGERHEQRLYHAPGSAKIQLNQIPAVALYFEQIMPTLTKLNLCANTLNAVAKHFLQIYADILKQDKASVAITPRDLEAICGLYAMQVIEKEVMDEEQHIELARRVTDFYQFHLEPTANVDTPLFFADMPLPDVGSDFVVLQEHADAISMMNSFLKLRTLPGYQGIRKITLEGPSGIGKSELVKHYLLSQGYRQRYLDDELAAQDGDFYHLSANTSLEIKKAILEKAFVEGAVVIFDECNTSLLPESIVNRYLSEESKLLMIGTQNPGYFNGRLGSTLAEQRREFKITLPPYSEASITRLIQIKYPQVLDAEHWAQQYVLANRKAQQSKKHGITLREFLADLITQNRGSNHAEVPMDSESDADSLASEIEMDTSNSSPSTKPNGSQQLSFFSLASASSNRGGTHDSDKNMTCDSAYR